ncbi:hypothetical protein MAUB_47960 [Mycolicibacterium aubagnense]|uniref:Resolvase/invertase-type recombinase catalytic domain-containing protein n=1 Tax=Mycolicibacterium aubagnense TaxID=319707 RepID=A0ABN5YZ04_9MYCO|nr:hypothetical protein MAUB_47960 [Mycolicibacterium aubagnense]
MSVTDGIDSSTAAGRMMIGVLGALAKYERELIKERTALKRVTARANGTKFGRPRKVQNLQDVATAIRDEGRRPHAPHIAKYPREHREVSRCQPGDVVPVSRR